MPKASAAVVPETLVVRKLADKSTETRYERYDPESGEKKLVNPATPGEDHEPWPLLGVHFADTTGAKAAAPRVIQVPMKYVTREPWIEMVNATAKVVPAGPPEDPWKTEPHTFLQCDALILHTVDGDVRYRVLRNPGKYDTETDQPTDSAADPTTYVVWDYLAELEA